MSSHGRNIPDGLAEQREFCTSTQSARLSYTLYGLAVPAPKAMQTARESQSALLDLMDTVRQVATVPIIVDWLVQHPAAQEQSGYTTRRTAQVSLNR